MGCSYSRADPEPLPGALSVVPPPLADSRLRGDANIRVKLVLLGDSGVGKTCLVKRFVHGSFDESSKVTVGVRSRPVCKEALAR